VLELDGERIARCTPHIGYLHSGFEKLGEHHDYNQYVCTISRMDYISPIVNDIAFHTGVERFFGIEPTPRCKVVRTIMAELGRIQNHLLCVGAAALDLGGFTGFLYGFTNGRPVYDSARLGSMAAAEVISHIGARPEVRLRTHAETLGLL
jgi:NADH-quinone oxidoreductase subunit D